MLNKKFIKLQ